MVAGVPDLCPACGRREIDTPSGVCTPCALERMAEAYAAEDRRRAVERTALWMERTGEPQAAIRPDALRQIRRQLRLTVQPRTPPPATADPWVLGAEAIHLLTRVKVTARSTKLRRRLDDAIELIRQLAWGPDP
jgi:hypothetical protein